MYSGSAQFNPNHPHEQGSALKLLMQFKQELEVWGAAAFSQPQAKWTVEALLPVLSQHSPKSFQAIGLSKLRELNHTGKKLDCILPSDKKRSLRNNSRIWQGGESHVYLWASTILFIWRPSCLSTSPWYSLVKWQHSSSPLICLTPWIVGSNISSHSPELMTDGVQRCLNLSPLYSAHR